MGHTIQEQGINSACAEQVFRIDVGMSKGCGNGEPEVMIFTLAVARVHDKFHLGCLAAYTMFWLISCKTTVLHTIRTEPVAIMVLTCWCMTL